MRTINVSKNNKCLFGVLSCQITNSQRSLYNIICACVCVCVCWDKSTFARMFASASRFTHSLSFFLCECAPSNTYSLYNIHPVPAVCVRARVCVRVYWNVWTTYSKGFHSLCLAKLMATSIMTSSQQSVIGLQTLSLSANHTILCRYTPSPGCSHWLKRRGWGSCSTSSVSDSLGGREGMGVEGLQEKT